MMKRYPILPTAALVCGVVAFALRLVQNRTGFEAATGLPVPGNSSALFLVVWLVLSAALLTLLVRKLPKDTGDGPAFPDAFTTDSSALLCLPVAGALLMALSGLADVLEALTQTSLLARFQAAADPYATLEDTTVSLSANAQLLMGLLVLLAAAALLTAAVSCRRADQTRPFRGELLLAMPVALVVRLVLIYRLDSIDPSVAAYYVELLALVFLTLAFYRLSSFAFQAGRTRRFALYAGLAVVFSMAALADGGPLLSSLLLYAGGTVTLLGLLLLRLAHTEDTPTSDPD